MPVDDATAAPHALAPIVSALRAAGCVFAEDEAQLLVAEAPDSEALAEWVDRRMSGMPLEHILGCCRPLLRVGRGGYGYCPAVPGGGTVLSRY